MKHYWFAILLVVLEIRLYFAGGINPFIFPKLIWQLLITYYSELHGMFVTSVGSISKASIQYWVYCHWAFLKLQMAFMQVDIVGGISFPWLLRLCSVESAVICKEHIKVMSSELTVASLALLNF